MPELKPTTDPIPRPRDTRPREPSPRETPACGKAPRDLPAADIALWLGTVWLMLACAAYVAVKAGAPAGVTINHSRALFTAANAASLTGFETAFVRPADLGGGAQLALAGVTLAGLALAFVGGGLAMARVLGMRGVDRLIILLSVAGVALSAGLGVLLTPGGAIGGSLANGLMALAGSGLRFGPSTPAGPIEPSTVLRLLIALPLSVAGALGPVVWLALWPGAKASRVARRGGIKAATPAAPVPAAPVPTAPIPGAPVPAAPVPTPGPTTPSASVAPTASPTTTPPAPPAPVGPCELAGPNRLTPPLPNIAPASTDPAGSAGSAGSAGPIALTGQIAATGPIPSPGRDASTDPRAPTDAAHPPGWTMPTADPSAAPTYPAEAGCYARRVAALVAGVFLVGLVLLTLAAGQAYNDPAGWTSRASAVTSTLAAGGPVDDALRQSRPAQWVLLALMAVTAGAAGTCGGWGIGFLLTLKTRAAPAAAPTSAPAAPTSPTADRAPVDTNTANPAQPMLPDAYAARPSGEAAASLQSPTPHAQTLHAAVRTPDPMPAPTPVMGDTVTGDTVTGDTVTGDTAKGYDGDWMDDRDATPPSAGSTDPAAASFGAARAAPHPNDGSAVATPASLPPATLPYAPPSLATAAARTAPPPPTAAPAARLAMLRFTLAALALQAALVWVVVLALLGLEPQLPLDRLLFVTLAATFNVGLSPVPIDLGEPAMILLAVLMLTTRALPVALLWRLATRPPNHNAP